MRCPTLKKLPLPPPDKTGWPWTEESPQLPDTTPGGDPWPRISIVTPSLNQGQFIEETIRSVLLQGYPNLEYIIIDGGSTDGAIEIIKKYEKWLTYWVSEPDRGQSQAINKGFRISTGKIVAWLNSDDYYEKAIMVHVASHLQDGCSTDFIYGDGNDVDENGKIMRRIEPRQFNLIHALFCNPIPQHSCFWRSIVLTEMGYLKENYHYSMDHEFWIRCGVKKKFCYIPILFANYRHHPTSKKNTKRLSFLLERLNMVNDFFLKPPFPPDHIMVHKNKVLQHWNERLAIEYFDANLMKEACNHFKKAIYWAPYRIQNLTLLFYIIDTIFGSRFGTFIQTISKSIRIKINPDQNY
jgi:glycosyltransferase involved in cell wall biosynthesis